VKTSRMVQLVKMATLGTVMAFFVAIGLCGTQERAGAWSAGRPGIPDWATGGAHGMMAKDAIHWLDDNDWLPTDHPTASDWELVKDGASMPDSIWKPLPGGDTWDTWWRGAEQLEAMIDQDIVTCGFQGLFPPTWTCTCNNNNETCLTLKDDWENHWDHLGDHTYSQWDYWADKAKEEVGTNRDRAMIHAGYAMHYAMDYLNPAHLDGWGSAQTLWETMWDHIYVKKAWDNSQFDLVGLCFPSGDHSRISKDLSFYREANGLLWENDVPSWGESENWADEGTALDGRITKAVKWSEQVSLEILAYVFNFQPVGGCDTSAESDVAYVYSSWGGQTMLDEISAMESLEPGKYDFDAFNQNSVEDIWAHLDEYEIILIDEDTFYSDGSWSRLGGPIYNSFITHAAELESFVRNGGAIFTSGENDLYRTQAWDWLPPGMQVTSYDPERTSSVRVVYDPGSPNGLYSYPNTITNSYLSQGHTHAWFSSWDIGYTPTVRRNDNNQVMELFGVFGDGCIVVSHVEAEAGSGWMYMQNQLNFIKPSLSFTMEILSPQPWQTVFVGQQLTILVGLRDSDGNPVSGAIVTVNGPTGALITLNEIHHSPGTGIYQGTYTILPTDPIGEWVMGAIGSVGGEFPKQAISVQISGEDPPPVLSVPGDQSVQYSDPLDFGVSASDPDGDPLTLTASGLPAGLTFVDNGDGTGDVSGTAQVAAATYPVTFSASDGVNPPVSESLNILVSKEDATLAYSGDSLVKKGLPVTLRANVAEMVEVGPWPGDITKAAVFFDVAAAIGGGTTTYGPVSVSATGEAIWTLPSGLPANVYSVDVRINPANAYYTAPPADTAALVVYDPSAGFTTGGGWVTDGAAKGNFGFSVKYLKGDKTQGQALYVYRSDGMLRRVKSNSMQWLVINGNTAVFRGKATIDGLGGNNTFEITVVDNGEPGRSDTFAIKIWNAGGTLIHQVTSTQLGGGNLIVPQPKRR